MSTDAAAAAAPARARWLPRLAPVLLFVAVAAVYGSSLAAPWVWDDSTAIVDNPAVRTFWPLSEAFAAPDDVPVAGRPVTSFTLALDYLLFGLDVTAFRATNALIHALAAWSLFGLIRRTLRSPVLAARFGASADGIALASALLWVVHPLVGECVSYLTQRTTSLFGLFFLLTLYAVARSAASGGRWRFTLAALAACLAGMGSKEVMVTAPVVALVYDRLCWSDSYRGVLRERGALHAGLFGTWLALVWFLATGPDYTRLKMGYAVGVGPFDYLVAQAPILVHYLVLAVWPAGQVLDYGRFTPAPVADAIVPGVLLAAVLVVTLRGVVRGSVWALLPFVCFAVLSPTSSVVPVGGEVGAERRMYVPLAALVTWMVAFGAERLTGVRVEARAAAVAVAILALGAAAHTRAELFLDPVELWRNAVAATPDNPRPHVLLGNQLVRTGAPEEGADHYRRAIALDPKFVDSWNNLATVHHRAGRYDEAILHYLEAARLAPRIGKIHYNLALAYRASSRDAEAARAYARELELDPVSVAAIQELAWLLATSDDPAVRNADEAVRLARRADQLVGGTDPAVLDTVAVAHAAAGEWTSAVEAAERALALDPSRARRQRLTAARAGDLRLADFEGI